MNVLRINKEFIKKIDTLIPFDELQGDTYDKAFTYMGILMDVCNLSVKEAYETVFLDTFEEFKCEIEKLL